MLRPILSDTLSALPGIRHGFFGRQGGVSDGIYASLNAGLGSKDRTEAVIENRDRIGRHLGSRGDQVVTLHQIHSATAIVVDKALPRTALPKADALVTRTPGVVIGALAADCTPILFADPGAKVVAAAHAGWRGALGGVIEATVEAMVNAGARRAAILAVVGPCIGPQSYEVGPDFEAQFLAADPAYARFFHRRHPAAKPHFDLPGFALARLQRLGLAAAETVTRCTYANESELFSYRRATHRSEPDYGRQISAIVVT